MARIQQLYFNSDEWNRANPILLAGEMGIEKDTGKFKFGDGRTKWKKLKYSNGQNEEDKEIVTKNSLQDFPTIGDEDKIYRSKATSKLYQYIDSKYVQLDEDTFESSIDVIDGGNAEDLIIN